MAFLVRMVLEGADSLERGIAIFHDNPRTCEYYFVIADGETIYSKEQEHRFPEDGEVLALLNSR